MPMVSCRGPASLLALALLASACAGSGQSGSGVGPADVATHSPTPASRERPDRPTEIVFTKGVAHVTASGGTTADEDVALTNGSVLLGSVSLSYGRPDPSGRAVVGVTISPAARVRVFVRNFIVEPRVIGGPDPCTVTVSRNDTSGVTGTFDCPDVRHGGVEISGGFGAVKGTFEASR